MPKAKKEKGMSNQTIGLLIGAIAVIVIIAVVLTIPQGDAGIANPASTYCIEQGGIVDLRNTPEGQKGFCVFSDLTECEDWAFYRGECTKETASACKDVCGDGVCDEMVCEAVGCPCAETAETCPEDCS